MHYRALATDYDGTLARDGAVAPLTLRALQRFRSSGRLLVLVTGRQLADLLSVFPDIHLFDRVVAENGGVLYDPKRRSQHVLGSPPSAELLRELGRRGVAPLSTGSVIVATLEPHAQTVRDVIRDFGLDLDVILNKDAVMLLPSGIDKASGLAAALAELDVSIESTVGIGDAENDQVFLNACGCSVAVANALSGVKASADLVMSADDGAGVIELIESVLKSDGRSS